MPSCKDLLRFTQGSGEGIRVRLIPRLAAQPPAP